MNRLILTYVLFICSAALGDEVYRCPNTVTVNRYLKTFGDYCFEFIPREKAWNDAYYDCQSRQGHLVVIKDEETQKFILSTLKALHWPRNGIWIGASDRQKEMEWKWVTGHLVKDGYSNWASGQPSCHVFRCFEDCGQMRLDDGGKWHDYHCAWIENYSYICQYKLAPQTTSSVSASTNFVKQNQQQVLNTTFSVVLMSETSAPVQTEKNNTLNKTDIMLVRLKPAIEVDIQGHTGMSKMGQSNNNLWIKKGPVVCLVLGALFGLLCGLLVGLFLFKHTRQKKREEVDTVIFHNPCYADVNSSHRVSLNDGRYYNDGSAVMTTGKPIEQPFLPTKRCVQNFYGSPPTLSKCRVTLSNKLKVRNLDHTDYDEAESEDIINAKEDQFMLLKEQRALEGNETEIVDNHYDTTTGEHFYESVANLHMAMEQNYQNHRQAKEEYYVPF